MADTNLKRAGLRDKVVFVRLGDATVRLTAAQVRPRTIVMVDNVLSRPAQIAG